MILIVLQAEESINTELKSAEFLRTLNVTFPLQQPHACRRGGTRADCLRALTQAADMVVKEELLDMLQKVWTKLQGLPHASSLELGAFLILVLFIATFLLMIMLSCVHCCCCGKPKYQASRVQPIHPV
ncbi:small integral membrane protein 5 [Arapaima gigas]